MQVRGLDGRTYQWVLRSSPQANCSEPHARARDLLARLFPAESRLEELTLPGTKGLRADFFLPHRRMVVEVQGDQHDTFVPFFHADVTHLWAQRQRDQRKQDWCNLNDVTWVELPHDESEREWTERILGETR